MRVNSMDRKRRCCIVLFHFIYIKVFTLRYICHRLCYNACLQMPVMIALLHWWASSIIWNVFYVFFLTWLHKTTITASVSEDKTFPDQRWRTHCVTVCCHDTATECTHNNGKSLFKYNSSTYLHISHVRKICNTHIVMCVSCFLK